MIDTKTMKDYIFEGGKQALYQVENRKKLVYDLVQEYKSQKPNRLIIIASGSSYNSVVSAKEFMFKLLKIEIQVIFPATFTEYYYEKIQKEDMLIVVSQGGYSTNSIRALNKIIELNIKAIGVTGNIKSDFKNYSDLLIDYGVGEETVGYVTKGVTTMINFFYLFALEVSKELKYITDDKYNKYIESIKNILNCHDENIERTNLWIKNNLKSLSSPNVSYYVAIGSCFGIALEGALKFGEVVLTPTMAYEMEEYIHGHNLQLNPNYSIFIFDNGDHTSNKAWEIFEASSKITDRVFIITSKESDDLRVLTLNSCTEEFLKPLAYISSVQVLSQEIYDYLKPNKHPLLEEFKTVAKSKSENYISKDSF